MFRYLCWQVLLFLPISLSFVSTIRAERPTAPKLFPDNTMAYVRINDTREMRAKLKETGFGRMGDDPQLKPILGEFYSSLTSGLKGIQEALGVSLDEILSIPNGELAIGVVPSQSEPAVMVMLEAGDELPPVEILLGKLEDRLESRGSERQTKDLAGIKLVTWRDAEREQRQMGYFIDQGVIVLCSKVDVAEKLAKAWTANATDFKPLSENRRFTNILAQCVGVSGERPQASFFVDPIALVRESTKNNASATMVTAMLPVLGLDGIQGLGGSLILLPEDFDSIFHLHLQLASPRRNVMELVRPKSGTTDPEVWVSEDVASYFTLNWYLGKTITAIAKLVDSFQGENAFQEKVVQQASNQLGIDFQKDFLDQLNDRLSFAQVFVRPAKINSGSNVYCAHLKDGKKFSADILPKVYEKLKARDSKWETSQIASYTVYQYQVPNRSEAIRAPEVCLTVVDNMLIASDSRSALEQAINTSDGRLEPLNDSLEFKMVRDRIKQQLGERVTSIASFQRPEESMRLFYDLAADPANKQRLKAMSENNPLFAALHNALDRHKLPPFEVIAKYLAPQGSFVVEDDSGIHQTSFSLRRFK